MPSICEICLIEGITEGANVYEDGEKLRAHLIEYHSKFVAKALLVPKISDKIHIWLLANIDYSSNTEQFNDEHKNEEDFYIKEEPSTSTTSNSINLRIQNADPQEEQNEGNYSGKNELDNQALENLLKGLLDQANNEEEGHQMHKGDQPTNSGTLATEENIDGELDFFAPLKSLLLSTASDKEKPDGESFPLRAALVDSKAVRKAHCQVILWSGLFGTFLVGWARFFSLLLFFV